MKKRFLPTMLPALLAGCSQTPAYVRPDVALPATFREAPGWRPAKPADHIAKGEWWRLFDDPVLNDLEARMLVSNQNLAAASAAYAQARATMRAARAGLMPQVTLSTSAVRNGSFGNEPAIPAASSSLTPDKSYRIDIGASWEPDLWGRIGSAASQAGAQAQASQADLLNATLAAQGELAVNYLQLRAIEAQGRLLRETTGAYARALSITTSRYRQGVGGRIDVLQAEAQFRSARADQVDLDRQRALLEHAIAVLVGENPSTFALAPGPWVRAVPAVPPILPGELLQRRPDIAAAERRVAAANAAIGIERAAFFPTIGLSADTGAASTSLDTLFDAASSVWSLGLSSALTLLDFGARSARVKAANAAHSQAEANYRQTVLAAFQAVEDQLAAIRILSIVADQRASAAQATAEAEQISMNQYIAGQIGYSDVIVSQTSALAARQQDISAVSDRQTAAIALIQAIGGYWGPAPEAAQDGPRDR